MILRLAIAAALLATPAVATAQEVPADATAVKKDDDRPICRSSNEIGSRLKKKKTCMTAREWADLAQQTQEKARDLQRAGKMTDALTAIGQD